MEPARRERGRKQAGGRAGAILAPQRLELLAAAERGVDAEADRALGETPPGAAKKAAEEAADNHNPTSKLYGGAEMPGMDRTGPMGAGPMTGGGRGRCNPANAGVNPAYFAGLGRRRGFGGGFAGGMGRGRRRVRWQPMAFGFDYPTEPAAEIERLQAEAEALTKTLDWLNARIKELQGKTPEQ